MNSVKKFMKNFSVEIVSLKSNQKYIFHKSQPHNQTPNIKKLKLSTIIIMKSKEFQGNQVKYIKKF